MENEDMLKKLIEVFELFTEFNNKEFKDIYNGLNMNEVHSIDLIGSTERANVTKVTNKLKITKGGGTKIIKRLLDKNCISIYQIEGNKKEKYFKLESNGIEIFKKHKQIHKECIAKDMIIFDNFDESEKEIIEKFLDILKGDLISKL